MALSLSDLFFKDPLADVWPLAAATRSTNSETGGRTTDPMLGATDVLEFADCWQFRVDVPGVPMSDLQLDLVENTLTIKGSRKHTYMTEAVPKGARTGGRGKKAKAAEDQQQQEQQQPEDGDQKMKPVDQPPANVHRVERAFGSFSRAFKLPHNVDTSGIKASCDNGVLTVTVPKAKPVESVRIPIMTGNSANAA